MSKGTIIITGASAGLGAEMARRFAALGYDLGLGARRGERLAALREEITAAHPDRRVVLRVLDVTDGEAVSTAFTEIAAELGTVDRVIVNAGLGRGAAIGTGRPDVNRRTALTNFVGALAQTEAAMEIFRAQGHGHLVMISSMSALRGMRRAMTVYAATKAGVSALAEGLRSENVPGVDVSVIHPGYIRTEMNEHVAHRTRFMVDLDVGVRSMVTAIEKRRVKAYVPAWPWVPIGFLLERLPLSVVRRLT
ncbi:SDR family oxidoreductase [Nocardiopsis sp. MG754419]|uniref:SDR family oxidoreductase n=1 Tax=Nocardiopsis sp. MG754419 TaxID=2259865 RepID=UPI001BAC1A26|nr:SDR family oxidoreductase [Nocardiopsis sp. MG754419]MBR8740261.1 short chain dehydrogenase [Nocardiopsis sp. MG754419]